jgi:hypothetical protein
MRVSRLIDLADMGAVAQWLVDNQHDFDIVPRTPTKQMRGAFHASMDDHNDGIEYVGCPDDQWTAMLNVHDNDATALELINNKLSEEL